MDGKILFRLANPRNFRNQIMNKSENPILMLSLDLVDLEKGMEVSVKV
jgi:hypothetical protein